MSEPLTGWAELRALLDEARALVDEIEPLVLAGTVEAWQINGRVRKLAARLEQAVQCCRQAKAGGWRVVRDETGKVIRMVWWG